MNTTRISSTTALVSLVLLVNGTAEVAEPMASDNDDSTFRDDACPNVELLGDAPFHLIGTNMGAGDDAQPTCGGQMGGEDVTFTWIVPQAGFYRFDTMGSDYDTILTVQEGVCVNGMELACDDDSDFSPTSIVGLDLDTGQELTIILDAYGGFAFGTYNLNILSSASCPLPLDLGSTAPQQVAGSVADVPGELLGSCAGDGPETTFLFTAPADGIYTFDTVGSNFDTVLYVRDTTCLGQELKCNDDTVDLVSKTKITSKVTAYLGVGQEVYIVLDAFFAGGGDYILNIAQGAPPEGNCCIELLEPACGDPAISACVCAFDPYCCDTQWTEFCAWIGINECGAMCP